MLFCTEKHTKMQGIDCVLFEIGNNTKVFVSDTVMGRFWNSG